MSARQSVQGQRGEIMNIKEAYAKATPGRMTHHKGTFYLVDDAEKKIIELTGACLQGEDVLSRYGQHGGQRVRELDATQQENCDREYEVAYEKDQRTAALLAHNYNHMLEVLDVLNDILGYKPGYTDPIVIEGIFNRAHEVYKKASEVKV